MRHGKKGSVDEAEEPEGDLVSVASLDVSSDYVAVWEVCNLSKAFFLATHLKEVLLVHLQVAL